MISEVNECVETPAVRCQVCMKSDGNFTHSDVISDVNECVEAPAMCSQMCINSEGIYTC